jgi:hypothetical protein
MCRILVALLLSLGLVQAAAAAPGGASGGPYPFHNGGFERGSFAGWTLDAAFTLVMSQDYDGFAPHSGSHYALLGTRGADGTLSQDFLDVVGQKLRIGFWLASDGALPNDFAVSFNGAPLLALASLPRGGWTFYYATVIATGLDRLTFSFRNDAGYLALDQVSVHGSY